MTSGSVYCNTRLSCSQAASPSVQPRRRKSSHTAPGAHVCKDTPEGLEDTRDPEVKETEAEAGVREGSASPRYSFHKKMFAPHPCAWKIIF